MMRVVYYFVAVAVWCGLSFPQLASAGLLDSINNATKKLQQATDAMNQKTQQTQQKNQSSGPPPGEDPDRPLHLEDYDKTGSCEGKRSATCMDYMEIAGNCMAPLKGYRMKLLGNLIEKKLKEEQLTDKQRKNLEEDLAGAREAEKNKSDDPTIAGQPRSQRYLEDISEEDQVCINADYNTFYKKIYNKCMGADHMGIGKRTEMMQDQETMTCAEAVAAYRAKRKKEDAPMNCMMGVAGLRYTIMAEMMEKKIQGLTLTDQERSAWEEDITLMRETAKTGGTKMPQSPDPANPTRWMMRLSSPEDSMAINNQYMARMQTEMAKCNDQANQSAQPESKSKGKGLVDHSQSPANKNAKKQTVKQYDDLNKGRGGSTNLLALRRDKGCADQLKGHLAKVTADKLEAKLKAAGSISDQKRQEWQEDIAAWRAAEAEGVDSPEPPDPANPYRWYDYVTNQERAQINQTHATLSAKIMKECNSRPSGL